MGAPMRENRNIAHINTSLQAPTQPIMARKRKTTEAYPEDVCQSYKNVRMRSMPTAKTSGCTKRLKTIAPPSGKS